jgi:hypothetical protein
LPDSSLAHVPMTAVYCILLGGLHPTASARVATATVFVAPAPKCQLGIVKKNATLKNDPPAVKSHVYDPWERCSMFSNVDEIGYWY